MEFTAADHHSLGLIEATIQRRPVTVIRDSRGNLLGHPVCLPTHPRSQTGHKSLHQQVMEDARDRGYLDAMSGLPCDPQASNYNARPGSAWDSWYRQGYAAGESDASE